MPPAPDPKSNALSESQRQALLTLLGDDDDAIWQLARRRLTDGGPESLQWLESKRLHPDPLVRRRVLAIFHERDAAAADSTFLTFLLTHGDAFDLEGAVWMFAKARYPEVNIDGYRALLDVFAGEIAERVGASASGEEQLGILNEHLFGKLGFRGNEGAFYEPENSYLNRVIDRRLGIPISLSAIYLFVSRRLNLPVTGIGMPGHFLCRYQSARETHYIDPFHGGKLLSAADCLERIQKLDVPFDEAHLVPLSPRRTLHRMIQNLHVIHREQKQSTEALRLHRYLVAIAR